MLQKDNFVKTETKMLILRLFFTFLFTMLFLVLIFQGSRQLRTNREKVISWKYYYGLRKSIKFCWSVQQSHFSIVSRENINLLELFYKKNTPVHLSVRQKRGLKEASLNGQSAATVFFVHFPSWVDCNLIQFTNSFSHSEEKNIFRHYLEWFSVSVDHIEMFV